MLWPAYDLQHTPASGQRDAPVMPLRIPANRLSIITGGQATERQQLLATLSGHRGDICGQLFGQPACPDKLQRLACCQQNGDSHCRQQLRRHVLQGRLPRHSWWLRGNEHDLHIVDQLLREFRLSHLAAQRFCQLTAAEQQLASIARSLASTAPIVLLDEPGLACAQRPLLLQQLQRLAIIGRTIVITLQDHTLARQHADWLIDLNCDAPPVCGTTRAPDSGTTASGGCLEHTRRSA